MANHKLKGVLGAKNNSSSHGSTCSLAIEEKRIADLEILDQHLQKCLKLYEDRICMENLTEGIGKYKIKEEKYDFYEGTLPPSQLEGFLEHKKAKSMYARYYDYCGRYDGYYQNDEYYERRGSYDEGLRFSPKLNIPKFDVRMGVDEFLDWLNMVEHLFDYYDPS